MTSWNGFLQAFTCSLSLTARYGKSLCYANCVAKVEGWMSRTVAIVCMVSVNYPRIIAVCGDNLNVGMYLDPSSSPYGLYIWRVWSESSMWYGIKEHQITVMALVLVVCIAQKKHKITVMALIMLVASEPMPLTHILMTTPSQVHIHLVLL